MKTKVYRIYFVITLMIGVSFGCTDLEEEILDEATGQALLDDPANTDNLVVPAYGWLRDLWWRQRVWGLQELTSDLGVIPTRGTDWFDGGVWVDNALHEWTPDHRDVRDTWNALSAAVAKANYALNLLKDKEDTNEIVRYRAELRLLRAFFSYNFLDLWGQVPFREYTETDFTQESMILKGADAFDFIVGEINEVFPDLGNKGEVPYGRVNKDVATAILAKMYLNKEVFTGTPDWPSAIKYCDDLINSGRYGIADDYFDIFSVDNHTNTSNADEAIFVSVMDDNEDMGVDQHIDWVHFTLHYNQRLGGNYSPWNGAIAPEGFLNKWDTVNDIRWRDDRTMEAIAVNLGFIYGQQYDTAGTALMNRGNDALLSFTFDCPLQGASEIQGVRVLKYEPKVPVIDEFRVPNDYVIYRISDFYLMRAEAKFRAGQDGLADLNAVRTKRGLEDLNTLTVDAILNERAFELYWEGHRRQDLIRFGRFQDEWTHKPAETSDHTNLFPIPQDALDVNTNLTQNPGYAAVE